MFRRIENTLEPDPSFPVDLKQLGFFVNNQGHIRMIVAPEKPYIFHATNNERVNEVRREAMQACQRDQSESRLYALGIKRVHLPGFTPTKPVGPHIPILSPEPKILKTRKRIIVIINDSSQDLGILAYRQLQRELGINGGSAVHFVKEIIKRSSTDQSAKLDDEIFMDGFKLENEQNVPALMVLNTGQLLYSHKFNQTMTMRSWSAMPRKSIAHDMIRIHDEENSVHGHRSPKEHIKTVFDEVLCNEALVAPDAELYVIAIEDGTASVIDVLADNFDKYGSRITAMALVSSTIDESQIQHPSLRAFLHQRTRQWMYTDATSDPLHCVGLPNDYSPNKSFPNGSRIMNSAQHIHWNEDLPTSRPLRAMASRLHRLALGTTALKEKKVSKTAAVPYTEWSTEQVIVCPTFAGGEESVAECIFTNYTVQHAILSFFEEVAQNPENYCNPDMKVHAEAPQPSPDNPLELSADDINPTIQTLPSEMTPEHIELDEARRSLVEMCIALEACPADKPELAPGREKLSKKVHDKRAEVDRLEKKALAKGGLKAGEAVEKRENWKPQAEGPKVPFAGSMVDSELLKAAGLFETAQTELEKLDGSVEEKAFV
ncbi:hypothetical protein IAQ61_008360 [Plenodomus lingam]|uniref:Arb2 domain-containing protein n=1 Tax=Leptosphaeria maculans (strain JN3 / isolate v23.1.3 / race Av1-4-5-6-7-8) TaxID=985895 RepID=E4ZUY1_LEPMJ|nr:hypothetical protein LEMA_P113330.1 [Plenodomus lingam JN3]KAH9866355.1 hypothetical protein IAQ61_008360 [Plenodomus lingam]CBX94918.1 hypothetical protein LEMA_P113330.1 [Plenodomus lingam JN3]